MSRQFPSGRSATGQAMGTAGLRGKRWINVDVLGILPDDAKPSEGTPMTDNPVLWNLDARGVATVTLNRPEVNNAYDGGLIAACSRRWTNSAGSRSFASWC